MDADLQDDPKEIPRFLEAIDGGLDLVSGRKKTRKDPLTKVIPSRIFNAMVRTLTGTKLHDVNCGFKAYRRVVIENVRLYGELQPPRSSARARTALSHRRDRCGAPRA